LRNGKEKKGGPVEKRGEQVGGAPDGFTRPKPAQRNKRTRYRKRRFRLPQKKRFRSGGGGRSEGKKNEEPGRRRSRFASKDFAHCWDEFSAQGVPKRTVKTVGSEGKGGSNPSARVKRGGCDPQGVGSVGINGDEVPEKTVRGQVKEKKKD